jgi:hypothetical protein
MPQHQDQHDVILTEIGRQAGSTGVHVIQVQFVSELVGTNVTATMHFSQTGDVATGDETTTHKLTIKKGLTTLGSITWQREIDLRTPADSLGGETLAPVIREPADSGTPTALTSTVWAPVLESGPVGNTNPTWTFKLGVATTGLALSHRVSTKNVQRWRVEGSSGGAVVYRGYLTATVSTSGAEPDPIDPDEEGGGANKVAGGAPRAAKRGAKKAAKPSAKKQPAKTPRKKTSPAAKRRK